MRLANVDGRAKVLAEGGVLDVAEATNGRFGPRLATCLSDMTELAAAMAGVTGPVEPLDEDLLGPPSPTPGQIIAIGMNYASHAAEMGLELPELPAAFAKFKSSLTGPRGEISLPSEFVDYEVELVVVIGRRIKDIEPDAAFDHVAGLCVGQDFSERRVQMAAGRQFALGKSYPGFAAIGPWLVTLDELTNPLDVEIGCSIDGIVVQDERSSDMIFKIPELLSILSKIIELEPGDIIFTGCPAGVGMGKNPPRYLAPGEELVTWARGIGEMRHRLV